MFWIPFRDILLNICFLQDGFKKMSNSCLWHETRYPDPNDKKTQKNHGLNKQKAPSASSLISQDCLKIAKLWKLGNLAPKVTCVCPRFPVRCQIPAGHVQCLPPSYFLISALTDSRKFPWGSSFAQVPYWKLIPGGSRVKLGEEFPVEQVDKTDKGGAGVLAATCNRNNAIIWYSLLETVLIGHTESHGVSLWHEMNLRHRSTFAALLSEKPAQEEKMFFDVDRNMIFC